MKSAVQYKSIFHVCDNQVLTYLYTSFEIELVLLFIIDVIYQYIGKLLLLISSTIIDYLDLMLILIMLTLIITTGIPDLSRFYFKPYIQ